MPAQHLMQPATGHFPDAGRAIFGRRGNPALVRTEGRRCNGALVAHQLDGGTDMAIAALERPDLLASVGADPANLQRPTDPAVGRLQCCQIKQAGFRTDCAEEITTIGAEQWRCRGPEADKDYPLIRFEVQQPEEMSGCKGMIVSSPGQRPHPFGLWVQQVTNAACELAGVCIPNMHKRLIRGRCPATLAAVYRLLSVLDLKINVVLHTLG